MDMIDNKKYRDTAKDTLEKEVEVKIVAAADFDKMLIEMQNPVNAQKEIAVKIKKFLDDRIDKEMDHNSILSDHTRRWVEQFNKILDSIQKSLYGDKSVNLHVHKVTHSEIASRMRDV